MGKIQVNLPLSLLPSQPQREKFGDHKIKTKTVQILAEYSGNDHKEEEMQLYAKVVNQLELGEATGRYF